MRTRRDFVRTLAAGTAAAYIGGLSWSELLAQNGAPKRREGSMRRKPIKGIDYDHTLNIADVARVVKGTPFERQATTTGDGIIGPERLAWMVRDGIDVALLTQQGAFW